MATNYPVSLQDLDATRGTATQALNSPSHVTHHTLEDDTLEALQDKVGIDSSAVTTSLDYILKNTTSGHDHDGTDSKKVIVTNLNVTGLTVSELIRTNSAGTALQSAGLLVADIITATSTTTLTNKTLTAPVIATIVNTGTLTLPTSTDTLVGRATTDTLTNKTINAYDTVAQTYTPSGAGTATLDLSLGMEHRITMPAGNITIAVSNVTNAKKFVVSITQDGTGSRTVAWFSTIKWAGGTVPTLTTTANKRDTFGFIRTGTDTYDGFIVGQSV